MDSKLLEKAGVNYDKGVKKFMNRVDVYERLLKNFLVENSFEDAREAIEKKNYEQVLKAIHGMKSVTGTLCMDELYKKCCDVVDSIRSNEYNKTDESFKSAYKMYTDIIAVIKIA